jgi:hypothetical protein
MQRPSRTARAAIVWAVASFALLQVGWFLASEFWLIRFRDPSYGPKSACLQQRLQGLGSQRPCTIVMLGSSRAADALNGQVSEETLADSGKHALVFNLGIPGAGPMQEYLTLRRLLADGVRPDVVLVEVMPPLLDERVGEVPLWMPSERLSGRDIQFLQEAGLPCRDLRHARRLDALVPWHARRFVILSMTLPKLLPNILRQDWCRACDSCGWVRHQETHNRPELLQAALEHAHDEYSGVLSSFHLGGASCHALRQTLATCRKEGIRAALVLMPEGSAFRSWYTPGCLTQTRGFLDGLQHEFDVPLIDAREWLADDDFVDSHHTRNSGAETFSRRLADEGLRKIMGLEK